MANNLIKIVYNYTMLKHACACTRTHENAYVYLLAHIMWMHAHLRALARIHCHAQFVDWLWRQITYWGGLALVT